MAASNNVQGQGWGAYQHTHTCTRCGGLLIGDGLFDQFDDTGHTRQWARRCVQCGDIVDPLILKRRAGVDLPALNAMRRKRWTGIDVMLKKASHR